jgi:ATP/maltotriose-dependent transcriptional regulator MalT
MDLSRLPTICLWSPWTRRLFLSEGTIRDHLSAAIQKLGAHNRAEAVRIAQEKGWLEPGL